MTAVLALTGGHSSFISDLVVSSSMESMLIVFLCRLDSAIFSRMSFNVV